MLWLKELQNTWVNNLYDTTSVSSGLHVYRRNFIGIHGSALFLTYPLTYKLIGAKKFRYLSQKLLHESPIKSGDLNEYGSDLAEVIASSDLPVAPHASDLASFEWACFSSINCSTNEHQSISYDAIKIDSDVFLSPSVRELELVYPVHKQQDEALKPISDGANIIVYTDSRTNTGDALYHELSSAEAKFVKSIQHSTSLVKATEEALSIDEKFLPIDILSFLIETRLIYKVDSQ
ncbi:DUF2063 domain-containing protein [Ketobacter sp. MCCC 1A13808]|uniref:HvfC/BufC family peptide modification chaperone n=1 Tax=Ketobacter sp. MCCC 1A13808 TaxID=2602738 RepID=UPI0012EBB59E|nr:putative DNA-binding domain-containing protein [Ketobacter sp. MCCC 1A13808]MVF14943.1 DUF2063 domain-containing protein [Ketobacter sp. MCCC 1A13808]